MAAAGVPPVAASRSPGSRARHRAPVRQLAVGQGDWRRVSAATLLQEGGGRLLDVAARDGLTLVTQG
jgi:hypothetical protein